MKWDCNDHQMTVMGPTKTRYFYYVNLSFDIKMKDHFTQIKFFMYDRK